MKTYLRFTVLSLMTLIFASCSEDELFLEPSVVPAVTPFHITVLVEENGILTPTDAEAFILDGQTVVSSYSLSASEDGVAFKGNPEQTYDLKVLKQGYAPYTLSFNYKDLQNMLRGKPMKVKMKPALELTLTALEDEAYSVDLEGTGVVTIVWPDQSVETHTLPTSFYRDMEAGSGQVIRLTGNLENISFFRAFGYNTGISEISGLKHLKEMQTFYPGLLFLKDELDLHQNRKLQHIDLFHATLPEWFRLPQQHYIRGVTVSLADRNITTNEIDLLINNIYKNTVRRSIHNGTIHLTGSDNPSTSAVDKIRILENEYGWDVDLNL